MEKDVLVAFAHSGENVETLKLADFCSSKKVEVVAITGNKRSSLAKSAKIVLDASVESESDPLGVVPTSSSSVTLSLGHAIAVALMHLRKVELSSFAALHPGGTLGAKIKRIKELTESPQELFVTPESDLKSVLERMQAKNLGIVGIAGSDGSLLGCITDGDVRRAFLRHGSDAFTVSILELATKNPVACSPGDSVWQCIQTMEEKEITALFVLEEGSQKPLGLVRLAQLRKD
jgi:arabinose-5-phosphate isomerase